MFTHPDFRCELRFIIEQNIPHCECSSAKNQKMTKLFNRDELLALATQEHPHKCLDCKSLTCEGWESIPGGYETKNLELIGTLRAEDAAESWEEYHPNGTDLWSKDAPIATQFHPYNKSDIYQCKKCAATYLRYLEAGGYYVDERIRELKADLIQ